MKRFIEASSFAGYGLICQGIAELINTHGQSAQGWAILCTGIAAVLKSDQGKGADNGTGNT